MPILAAKEAASRDMREALNSQVGRSPVRRAAWALATSPSLMPAKKSQFLLYSAACGWQNQ